MNDITALHFKRLVVVLDHEKKVLPQKYKEGSIEFFQKKGMCIFEAVVILYEERNNMPSFMYTFYDMIVEGYLDQHFFK